MNGPDHGAGSIELLGDQFGFLDAELLGDLVSAVEAVDEIDEIRASVIYSSGRHFCAGVNLKRPDKMASPNTGPADLYKQALALFRRRKPCVAALHGASVGGGLGLALVADFRVADETARFSANFSRLGTHPGFGLTSTLTRLIGEQHAYYMFHTGTKIGAQKALEWGLVDDVVPSGEHISSAKLFAEQIAKTAPLATESIRSTRMKFSYKQIEAAIAHELDTQSQLVQTTDFAEGVQAISEHREPVFHKR